MAGDKAVPESYPAVYVEQILDTLTDGRDVQAVYLRSATAWAASGTRNGRPILVPSGQWRWCRVAAHPLLSKAIPGAVFYMVVRNRDDEGALGSELDWDLLVAIRDGESYLLPWDLGQLLWDSGMKFRNSDVPVWARVGAVIWSWAYRADIGGWRSRDLPADSVLRVRPVFPALTFEADSLDDTLSTELYINGRITVSAAGRQVKLELMGVRERLYDSPGDRDGRPGFVPTSFVAPEWGGRYIESRDITTGQTERPR
jgi:hypothetical protein